MDSQKSPAKLTRTKSSLLRSLPSVRSSIHSLSSISEDEESLSEEKPRRKPLRKTRSGLIRFSSITLLLSLLFFFFYLGREEIPTSENLLIALIFIAVTLFLASKNKTLINQIITTVKQRSNRNHSSKPVQWFIGESRTETHIKKLPRETVEYYSNGDFYEGEFHKGKCNGSGIYYYFMKGKYEGDWIDGRYDGFGIESWARGSKYKGQYKQGSRHGHGVYRFYTGDSYSGEWCNGQSHGVGVQTCADGSCYVGEFKFGVKHGLGRYHFRYISFSDLGFWLFQSQSGNLFLTFSYHFRFIVLVLDYVMLKDRIFFLTFSYHFRYIALVWFWFLIVSRLKLESFVNLSQFCKSICDLMVMLF